MKTLSNSVQAVLAHGDVSYFHLVKIGPFKDASGATVVWLHTQAPGGITVDNERYVDDSNLIHIDSPRQSAAVDRESFKIVYSDSDLSLRSTFENGFSGVPVEINLGFYNTTDQVLNGVEPGFPLCDIHDLVTIYGGSTDNASYNIDLKGSITVTIECTSPMGALLMIRNLSTNKETLQQQYPNDTCYDELFIGSKGLTLLWGKKT